MAHKLAEKLNINAFMVKVCSNYEGTYYTHRVCWPAQKFLILNSNCKYFQNPGFVCPLSAYRETALFQIN